MLFGCINICRPINQTGLLVLAYTTYDCDHIFSDEEISGLYDVGGSVSQASGNINQIGALRLWHLSEYVAMVYGACLIIPMIVTWSV